MTEDPFIISEMMMAFIDGKSGQVRQNYEATEADENGMRNALALLINKGWKHETTCEEKAMEQNTNMSGEGQSVCAQTGESTPAPDTPATTPQPSASDEYVSATDARKAEFEAITCASICHDLSEACNGHPHAKIPWPHYLLHNARYFIQKQRHEITRLTRLVAAPQPSCPQNTEDKTFCSSKARENEAQPSAEEVSLVMDALYCVIKDRQPNTYHSDAFVKDLAKAAIVALPKPDARWLVEKIKAIWPNYTKGNGEPLLERATIIDLIEQHFGIAHEAIAGEEEVGRKG